MNAPATVSGQGLQVQAPPGALPLGGLFGAITALGCVAVGLLGLDQMSGTFCIFRLTTGLPCPTCGTTRAFGRLAHLDLAGAVAMNPLAAAGAVALVLWGLADLVLLPTRRALRLRLPVPWHNPARAVVLVLVLINWVFLLVARR